MNPRGITMVFWSYLLVGLPASASIENVLAPVGAEPIAKGAVVAYVPAADPISEESEGAQPLVQPGVDELDLLAELEEQLESRLQPAGRLRLIPTTSLPRLPASVSLPVVEIIDHPNRLTSSSVLIRFRLLDDSRVLGTYATSFRAQVLASVWVPARRLSPGTVLGSGDLVEREIDLVREPRAVLADDAILGRYEVSRAVVPERVLSWTDLSPRSLVRKGQIVEVTASEGALSITMKGQATRSGVLGETITIRNLESKREFPAEVVDENRVRVHF